MKIAPRMTDAEADAWREALFEHIRIRHPHLSNREELWKIWKLSQEKYEKIVR